MQKWPLALLGLLVAGCAPDAPIVTAPSSINSDASTPEPVSARWTTALSNAKAGAKEGRAARVAMVFHEWGAADLVEARRAAAKLTERDTWMGAHEALLIIGLAHDVREAVDWLLTLEPTERADVLLDQALAAWVRVDAPAAGAHVAGLDESDYRTLLAGEVASSWAARDPGAAAAWSGRLTDQEAREEALDAVIGAVVNRNPRHAAELTLALPGESDRAMSLERVVAAWWERDEPGLEAWVGQLADTAVRAQAARLIEAHREAVDAASADKASR